MTMINVVVIDDAVTVRRMLSDMIDAESDMKVVGTAPNGSLGLAKIDQVRPDLVTLDIEMPEMDGLAMISELRKTHPDLPVIVFSSQTERGAEITIDSLLLGATDYLAKPSGCESREETLSYVRECMIPKIRALAAPSVHELPAPSVSYAAPELRRRRAAGEETPERRVDAVVVGASTGGPNALAALVRSLPPLPVPVFIVLHMPPTYTNTLASRLDGESSATIRECTHRERALPGEGWLAMGGAHMVVEKEGNNVHVSPNHSRPVNFCRPSVDVLFRSAVRVYGEFTLGVVLTGMGADGMRGAEEIRDAGGHVLVQDEETSVVWGMPGAVEQAGLANRMLPLNDIGGEIARRLRKGR